MQTVEGDQITPNMTPNLHNIVLDGSGEPVSTMTVVKGATLQKPPTILLNIPSEGYLNPPIQD